LGAGLTLARRNAAQFLAGPHSAEIIDTVSSTEKFRRATDAGERAVKISSARRMRQRGIGGTGRLSTAASTIVQGRVHESGLTLRASEQAKSIWPVCAQFFWQI